ncbi:DNA repair protein complementing XP-C cells-like isoform X2 [Corticium candelabrum]|uniref:DNA repair protein complementing XP-C cells-like isoform X2 n=1 Tax=Corticium candelabrum TaxID=121492 RepID=UPI002E252F4D|nr:DNA repair protein complementing XP-C cells-like isoform X2 [Corticium candelabrum]
MWRFDGIIIAKGFEAWEQQQEEIERKAAEVLNANAATLVFYPSCHSFLEKHEKIVIGRRRKLIKGLLIQERLKRKYDLQDDSKVADTASIEAVSTSKLMLSNADKDKDTKLSIALSCS